jgi:hypothetical protein
MLAVGIHPGHVVAEGNVKDDDEQHDGDCLKPSRRRPELWIVDVRLLRQSPLEPKN